MAKAAVVLAVGAKSSVQASFSTDVSRKISPLVIPSDAYIIDTDKLTINEVFDKTLKYINN